MASVKREDTSQGPRWRVRYRRPDGSETSRRFDRRRLADDFAVRVEHDRRSGFYVDPTGPRTTFADMAARWQQNVNHAPATVDTRDRDLRNWVLPALGGYRLGQIGELELSAFLRTLEKADLAPATVERIWAWVTGVFGAAVRARLLTFNPTEGLAPPPASRPLLVPLEDAQVEAVIAALPAWYRMAAYLAAGAGLRNSECCGLTASRVSLPALRRRVLPVERQLLWVTGQGLGLTLPKGGKVRAVPITEDLSDRLAAHMAEWPRSTAADRVSGGPAELVFATRYGTPVRRTALDDAFAKAVKAAGLPEGTRFHDLRHYYAAVLIDAGLPDREIGGRLGHSSAEVTARYGHLFSHADERTRAAVEAAEARRAQVTHR